MTAVNIIPIELNAPDSISCSNAFAVPNACDAFPYVKPLAIEVLKLPTFNNIDPIILPISPVVMMNKTVIVSVPPNSCETSIPTAAVIERGNIVTMVSSS